MKQYNKIYEKLMIGCIVLVALCNFTPYITYNLPNLFMGLIYLITILITFFYFSYKDMLVKIPALYFWIFSWLLQMIIYKVIGISTCSNNKILFNILLYLFIPVLCKCISLSDNSKYWIINCLILIFLINLIDNIRLNIMYPGASEAINFPWGTQYYEMNVGGSTFSSLASLMALFCILKFLTSKKKKFFWILYYVLCFIYIYITARAISVLTLIIGSVALFLIASAWKINKNSRKIIYCIIVILGILFAIFVAPTVLNYLAEILNSERLSPRLLELADLLRFQNSHISSNQSSGMARLQLYMMSIKTFFATPYNFFFGVGEHPLVVSSLNDIGIGAHSIILDSIAEYGIWGLLCIYNIIVKSYKKFFKGEKNKYIYELKRCVFFVYIINSFINNTFSISFFVIIFFIIAQSKLQENN